MLCQILLFFLGVVRPSNENHFFFLQNGIEYIYIFCVCVIFVHNTLTHTHTLTHTQVPPSPCFPLLPLFFCFTSSSSPPLFSLVFLLSSPSASYNQVTPPLDAVTWKSSSSVKWLLSHACVSHGVSANP